jgi:hypothetical protein
MKPSSCTKNLGFLPYLVPNCQKSRSGQPTGGLTPTVYLFGRAESKAKNFRVAHEHREHKDNGEFILVQAFED